MLPLGASLQAPGARLSLTWRTKPGVAGAHAMTVPDADRSMESWGGLVFITTDAPAQKPPIRLKLPPLSVPASGWPMVPLNVKLPPLLVPPPPSMVNQSTLNDCALSKAGERKSSASQIGLIVVVFISSFG